MKEHAKDVQSYAFAKGILANVCHLNTIRLIPPLVIKEKETERFTNRLAEYLTKYN
jgi:acetylornithine/succinyldiaminopimelate/putrescine aminotransferase